MGIYDDLPGKDLDLLSENEQLFHILQLLNYQKTFCASKGLKPINPNYFTV